MTPTHTIRVNPVHTLAILAKGLVDAGIMTPLQAKTARITLYRVKEHKGKPGMGLTIKVGVGNENLGCIAPYSVVSVGDKFLKWSDLYEGALEGIPENKLIRE